VADGYRPTAKQVEAAAVIAGKQGHTMLFGGSRSGKTFECVRTLVMRGMSAPGSRHAMFRFRFNHIKASIILDTFPKVMKLCFPQVPYVVNKSDWYATVGDGSEVWFGGLDDKERTEKILGGEYSTLFFNECSQIPWSSVQMAITRLAQRSEVRIAGVKPFTMKPRAIFDCNPPPKSHWTYRVFVEGRDPDTKLPLPNAADFVAFQMNPRDNRENLPAGYIEQTLMGLSARMRRRFLDGEFGDATPNALFVESDIDKWRVLDGTVPQMVRVVVGVDPSGSGDEDNADNDEIGILVGGLGVDGNAYLMEDVSVKAGPATWGDVATSAFDRQQADVIVGEDNFGGAMVAHVIQTARPRTPYKKVTASRGKHVRAEPFSALYEKGKVRHVGHFPELEDELCAMSTTGYTGNGSPNRADAWIWVLAELFPGVVNPRRKPPPNTQPFKPQDASMGLLG
jgi:hypothetical protein